MQSQYTTPTSLGAVVPNVLLIDSKLDQAELLILVLEQAGLHVTHARSEYEAVAAVSVMRPDLLICDWSLEGLNGRAIIIRLKATYPRLMNKPVILLADKRTNELDRIDLKPFGVRWILEKPIVAAQLPQLVVRTLCQTFTQGIVQSDAYYPLQVEMGQTASNALAQAVV